jgi:hypothetical protein
MRASSVPTFLKCAVHCSFALQALAFAPKWQRAKNLLATRNFQRSFISNRGITQFPLRSGKDVDVDVDAPLVADLSEERKATLFQFLLRDLQVEGVPLLGVDAYQTQTMQAALWTTLAELSEQDDAQKACLIFEDIPMAFLITFVDDFIKLKSQGRLMKSLPELERFNVSLLGKGVGPAILIESAAPPAESQQVDTTDMDENKCTAAMKMFMDRVVAGMNVCPYTKNNQVAPEGLQDAGFPAVPIGYRVCASTEVCHVLSAFWNTVCELLVTPADQLSATMLSLPAVGAADSDARFEAVAELLSRSLCLYSSGDAVLVLELLHFYPAYDRDQIHPTTEFAHGHLPPTSWLRPMLAQNGNTQEASELSEQDLKVSNYQRRSPVPAVCIKRVEQINAGTDAANRMVDLALDDRTIVQARGVPTYARNVLRLVEVGADALREALDAEIAITK